jgi:hypothetical protein
MKITQILTAEMAELSESVIRQINFGRWRLYLKANISNDEYYALKTHDNNYILSKNGKVIKADQPSISCSEIDSLIYFSDAPFPKSLSNL